MHSSQWIYRLLLQELDSTAKPYAELLEPWLKAHHEEIVWLQGFAERGASRVPPATIEDIWRLYALSRVNDALICEFEPGHTRTLPDSKTTYISREDYDRFARGLGLYDAVTAHFHPFFHEIVEVVPAQHIDQPVTLLRQHWPPLMLGTMLLSRGGVTVSGGSNYISKTIAETTTLYWTSRRRRRPYADLSIGWGSNSRWRTRFRRDYHIGKVFHFNVDGANEIDPARPGPNQDGLLPSERTELLIHRCFIMADKPHDDLWPYDDRLQLSQSLAI